MKLTHAAIHHDVDGRCNELLAAHVKDIRSFFIDNFVVITRETATNVQTRQLLEAAGFRIIIRSFPRTRQLDTASHTALLAASVRGAGSEIFFGCLDRTLHMTHFHPEEFREIINKGTQGNDYLALGRTVRALSTHPKVQLEPEMYTNAVVGHLLGIPDIDVATGCRIMTKEAAKKIVNFVWSEHRFTNPGVDVSDGLWPYIIHQDGGRVDFMRTEGLEFETPDQFSKEIAELGYDRWVEQNFTTANIAMRMERAH